MTRAEPSKSEQIRALALTGAPVAEIARAIGVSYQFAYNVCSKAGLLRTASGAASLPPPPIPKPDLTSTHLLDGGFNLCGKWKRQGELLILPSVPKQAGVYAFAIDGTAQYVGVASRSLSQRLYGYARPGPTQNTNRRVNEVLLRLLHEGIEVLIYCASPPNLEWNGLPVNGVAGLEIGLLRTFNLPWNIQGL